MGKESAEAGRAEAISLLFGAYGHGDDINRSKIYLYATRDIPAGLLTAACKKLLIESKFLPSIAEIVEAARSITGEADEACRVKGWDEAWREIERAMYDTPWGKTPTFSTPEITSAVRNYGWNTLQASLVEDMPTVRAQVRRMYDDICRRTKERGNSLYAMGGSRESLIAPGREATGLTAVGDVVMTLAAAAGG